MRKIIGLLKKRFIVSFMIRYIKIKEISKYFDCITELCLVISFDICSRYLFFVEDAEIEIDR